MTELAQSRAHSTIRSYLSGVRHLHIIHGHKNPLQDSPRLHLVCKGIQRIKPKSSQPRLPVTPLILRLLKQQLQPLDDFDNAMIWAAACAAFFGFLRSAEFCFSALLLSDVAIDNREHPTTLSLFIKCSKTDQFHQGTNIYLSKTDLCPVAAITEYLTLSQQPDGPLFISQQGVPLTREVFITKVQAALSRAGVNPDFYKSHSFRIGAATTAAAQGINDSTMGRWSSDAFQAYIKIPRQDFAEITKSLVTGRNTKVSSNYLCMVNVLPNLFYLLILVVWRRETYLCELILPNTFGINLPSKQ